ncbi:hypothetical protein ABZ260_41135, partial [Streptosporangium sp. NPDC006013]|uniref:hypothetical protein n=1 Tax=Streptosporangium sp. NPDC006013 TaxID=3155596 RepID=UPI0033A82A65
MKSYFAVLGTPGAWRFLVPAFAARLPYAMLQLGVLLLVHRVFGSEGHRARQRLVVKLGVLVHVRLA